jgi:hypothetical protein
VERTCCVVRYTGMLLHNRLNHTKGIFTEIYVKEVRDRVNQRYWKIPKNFESSLNNLCSLLTTARTDPYVYVKAQVYFLSTADCQKLFCLKYPPINALGTKAAYERYHKYSLLQNNHVSSIARNVPENYEITLFTGSISEKDLEQAIIRGDVSEKEGNESLQLFRSSNANNED